MNVTASGKNGGGDGGGGEGGGAGLGGGGNGFGGIGLGGIGLGGGEEGGGLAECDIDGDAAVSLMIRTRGASVAVAGFSKRTPRPMPRLSPTTQTAVKMMDGKSDL